MNTDFLAGALVAAAREDMRKGTRKEDILRSLASLVSRELYNKVLERL